MAENEMDPAELVEKTLLVQNLGSLGTTFQSDSALQDKLTIHFQKKSNRGGDVLNVIYPLNSFKEDAIVIFADAEDMMSAAQHEHVFKSQHEPMCRSHPITVRRLPPVFASVEAKIDPLYFNIMPLGASAGFSKRIEKLANVKVDRTHAGKISCSHLSQLELVEREFFGLLMSHAKNSGSSEDDGFEAAGASNFGLHSKPAHRGLREHGYREDDEMEVAEENEGRRTTGSFSKQSNEPEDFLGDHSTPQMQPASTKEECDDKSEKKQSFAQEDVARGETDVDNMSGRVKNRDYFVLDKYTYDYLKLFKESAVNTILKQNRAQLQVVPKNNSEDLYGVIYPSNHKTTVENVSKAKDEFISFYQDVYFGIKRKTIDCSSIDAATIEKATKETLCQFKTDTLITKVDGSFDIRLILRHGDVDEVVRYFRKIAGIKSRKTLRNAEAGVHSTEDTRTDITRSTIFGADNPEVRSKDDEQNKQPSHNLRLASGSPDDDLEFITNEGMHIAIRTGDITKQSADAVVSPSDQHLKNEYGGVATAIIDAAGAHLRGQCQDIMKRRGYIPLKMAECIVTKGFNLKYKEIIYVCGPTDPSHQQFMPDLYHSFLGCLRTAERFKMNSLAVPLIGSGFIGASKTPCADALAHALIDFSREFYGSKYVGEVFLVNIDEVSSKVMQQSLQTVFNRQNDDTLNTRHVDSSYRSTAVGSGGSEYTCVGGMEQIRVNLDAHPLSSEIPHPVQDGIKQGESKGQVQKDRQVIDRQPRIQHLAVSERPKLGASKDQNKNNQKSEAGGTAAEDEAYGNRRASPGDNPVHKPVESTRGQVGSQDAKPGAQPSTDDRKDKCPICLADKMINEVALRCKHKFCKACIDEALKNSYRCPVCQIICSPPKGNQPDGTMRHYVDQSTHLSGYDHDGVITIRYNIPGGTQKADHPNPGMYFTGTSRTAYLPDNQEGREVLDLLKKAFDARLVFTVGQSVTTGLNDMVTWNDIHHKTCRTGGSQNHGYPDPDYLKRVKEDLAAKGIK